MSYRDDASALLARANALERELKTARREIAALRREAGYPVDDGLDIADVEIREDDLELARQVLSGLLQPPQHGAPAPLAPAAEEPGPTPERDAATEQLVVLRRALLALLTRKIGLIPAPLIAKVDACPTAARLIDWISQVGTARGRRRVMKIFDS